MEKKKGGNIAKDSMILVFVKIVTISVQIIQTMILSRLLTKLDYGTYSQGLLIISFFTPFFSLGLENAVNYFFNNKTNKEKYLNTIFTVSIVSGIVCGIMILGMSNWLVDYFDNPLIKGFIVYVAFRPCLQNLISLYQPLYISSGRAKVIAIRNSIISVAQVVMVCGISYYVKKLTMVFLGLLLMDIVQAIYYMILFGKIEFKINFFKLDTNLLKEIFDYSIPMLLSTSIATINVNVDKLMINIFMNTEEYALYSNVSKELPFAFIVTTVTTVVMPFAVKLLNSDNTETFKIMWKRYLEFGYLITWPLCVGAAVFSKEFILLLYSDKYLTVEGNAIFIIYTIVAMLRFTYFGMIASAKGETKIIMKYSIIGCVINLLLNYFLFYLMGMIGPAVSTLISLIAGAILYFNKSLKIVNFRLSEIFDLKKIMALILEMIVMAIVIRPIANIVNQLYGNTVITLLCGYSVFVISIMLLNLKGIKEVYLLFKDIKSEE